MRCGIDEALALEAARLHGVDESVNGRRQIVIRRQQEEIVARGERRNGGVMQRPSLEDGRQGTSLGSPRSLVPSSSRSGSSP